MLTEINITSFIRKVDSRGLRFASLRYFICWLIFNSPVYSQKGFHFTQASEKFTVPAGVTTVTIEVTGRGGNGGPYGGGGGGGGGFAKGSYNVVPGATFAIRVTQDTVAIYPFLYATAGAPGKGGYQNPAGAGGNGGKGVGGNISNAYGGNGGSGNPSLNSGGGGGAGGIKGNGSNGNNAPTTIPWPYSGALGGAGGGGVSGNGGKGDVPLSGGANLHASDYGGGGGGTTDWSGTAGGTGYCKISWGCDFAPAPVLNDFDNYSNQPLACSGQPTQLGARGYDTLLWFTDTTLAPFAKGASIMSPPLSYSQNPYHLYVRSSGCGESKLVLLEMLPTPTISALSSSQLLCFGETCTLSGNGAEQFYWSTGYGGENVRYTNSLAGSTDAHDTIKVIGSFYDGTCYDTCEVVLLLRAKPILQCAASKTTYCNGDTIALQATGPALVTFTWSNGIQTSSTAVIASNVTFFSVAATDTNVCTTDTVITLQNLTPIIQVFADKKTICLGDSAQVAALGAASYTWDTGQRSNPIWISPTESKIYSITGVAFTCASTATFALDVANCNGFNEQESEEQNYFFPNPTTGRITFAMLQNGPVKITDLNGKVVRTVLPERANDTINLGLSPGVYFFFVSHSSPYKVIVIANER
jgi:hypothetical protein